MYSEKLFDLARRHGCSDPRGDVVYFLSLIVRRDRRQIAKGVINTSWITYCRRKTSCGENARGSSDELTGSWTGHVSKVKRSVGKLQRVPGEGRIRCLDDLEKQHVSVECIVVNMRVNKLCGRPQQYASTPCKLTFDILTLKVVSESRVTWPTSVPILV